MTEYTGDDSGVVNRAWDMENLVDEATHEALGDIPKKTWVDGEEVTVTITIEVDD